MRVGTWEIRATPGPWHYHRDGFRFTIGSESTRHAYLEHDRTVAIIEDNSMQAEADAKAIAALPSVLSAAEEAYHELRVRCGYKPGDHVYDALAEALDEALGPQSWLHKGKE